MPEYLRGFQWLSWSDLQKDQTHRSSKGSRRSLLCVTMHVLHLEVSWIKCWITKHQLSSILGGRFGTRRSELRTRKAEEFARAASMDKPVALSCKMFWRKKSCWPAELPRYFTWLWEGGGNTFTQSSHAACCTERPLPSGWWLLHERKPIKHHLDHLDTLGLCSAHSRFRCRSQTLGGTSSCASAVPQ